MANVKSQGDEVTLRELYPHLNDQELREAEENLRRYLETGWKMFERIKADPEAYSQFKALTAEAQVPTIDSKASLPPNQSP